MQSRDDESWLKMYETGFGSNMKYVPQYRYFTRPLYKLLGADRYPLFSVPATFAITDIVIHQLLKNLVVDALTGELSVSTLLKFDIYKFFIWTSLSLPIAYFKQCKKLEAPQPLQTLHENLHTLFAAPARINAKKNRKNNDRVISDAEMAASCFGVNRPQTSP